MVDALVITIEMSLSYVLGRYRGALAQLVELSRITREAVSSNPARTTSCSVVRKALLMSSKERNGTV